MTKGIDLQYGAFNPVSGERTLFTLSGGKGFNDVILKIAFAITSQNVVIRIKDSLGTVLSSDTITIVVAQEVHWVKHKVSLSAAGSITVTITQLGYVAGVQNYSGIVLNAYDQYGCIIYRFS